MNDEDYKLLYNDACITCESCNGRHTQRAINLLLQLINGLREDMKRIEKQR